MKLNFIFVVVWLPLMHTTFSTPGQTRIEITNTRCEYLVNPVGIDVSTPRFSWETSSDIRNIKQVAYQVIVSSSPQLLENNQGDVWDSKRVERPTSSQVVYAGNVMAPGKLCYWKVTAWYSDGSRATSKSNYWTWGPGSSWKAKWIGLPKVNVPVDSLYYPHKGYRSVAEKSPDSEKWIILDIGTPEKVDAVRIYPVQPDQGQPGMFPAMFRLEGSQDAKFAAPTLLYKSKTMEDTGRQEVWAKQLPGKEFRYIRMVVTRLPKVNTDHYGFGLAEIELLQNMKSIPIKDVQVKDETYVSWESRNWVKANLIDGHTRNNTVLGPQTRHVPASPLLRRTFAVNKKVKQAFLYATALGLYEARLNGKKVGNQYLAPEWTDYHKRVQYQTYDVTAMLRQGENALGAMLADGWYIGPIFSHPYRGAYGFDRRLSMILQVVYDDNTTEEVTTDGQWKYQEQGPITAASIFDGEIYDARKEKRGWDEPGFDDRGWKQAVEDNTIAIPISAQMNEPIAVVQVLKPVHVFSPEKDVYIFDLGQNFAGWCQLRLPYNPKDSIKLRYAEVLNEDSTLYVANLRDADQTDIYIPAQEASIDWEPRFTYHGFRFVEVRGLPKKPDLDVLAGKVVNSSSPITGSFECSLPEANRLWKNILWTQRSNMHSVPTDCPQRDERAGWMGDAQVFSQTAIFNMDMAAFFTKWVRDIRDSQLPDGRMPDFAPHVGLWQGFFNSPGWADAGVIVPWRVYQNYNDTVILRQQYGAMKAFINFVKQHNPDLIWKNAFGNMYGDWLNGNTIVSPDYPKEGAQIPNDVYSTAFFAYSTRILAKTAALLHEQSDAAYYATLADKIEKTFVDNFVKPDGLVASNTQAAYAMALDFKLVPKDLEQASAKKMVDAIVAYDYRISTGIQSTIRLMNQLCNYGYCDIAYKLFESRRFPSWFYSIDQGATTIWERWDGYVKGRGFQDVGMNSFNHYAIGAVGEWMYKYMLGIRPAGWVAGYQHFEIHPVPGGNIRWAKGSYSALTGRVGVSWRKEDQAFAVEVEVPVNATATVVLPAGKRITGNDVDLDRLSGVSIERGSEVKVHVGSGKYVFQVQR